MRVATPIVSPSIVSEARSLWARRASKHSARLSRTASIGAGKHFQLHSFNPNSVLPKIITRSLGECVKTINHKGREGTQRLVERISLWTFVSFVVQDFGRSLYDRIRQRESVSRRTLS